MKHCEKCGTEAETEVVTLPDSATRDYCPSCAWEAHNMGWAIETAE